MLEYLERSLYLISEYPDTFVLTLIFFGSLAYFVHLLLKTGERIWKEAKTREKTSKD